jgi:hypothetical protein
VRNFGGATATNIVVHFDITDPPGKGINGANGFIPLGTVSSAQFPALASLAAGAYTDVYLDWTPNFPLTPEQIAAGVFYFHTCVRVRIDPVTGETVFGNQDGDGEQENIDYFQAPAPSKGAAKYSDIIHLRNDDPAQRKYFYLSYVPHLPDGWTVNINGGVLGMELDPGQVVDIPVVIQSGGSVTPTVGDIFSVDIAASSQRNLVNASDPNDIHIEFKPLGGVTVDAYVMQQPRLRCDAVRTGAANYPFIWGRLDQTGDFMPPTGQGVPIFLEGVDDRGSFLPLSAQIVYTTPDGHFMGHLSDRNQVPLRRVVCLFAGTDKLMSASSGFVPVSDTDHVAYVYASDSSTISIFSSFFANHGVTMDAVPLAQAASFNFSAEKAIVIAHDAGNAGVFGSAAAADAIKMSGKPVLGLGQGGSALFQLYGLKLGYSNTWLAVSDGIDVVSSSNSVWSVPYPLSVVQGQTLQIYSGANPTRAVYLPAPVPGVTPVGRQTGDASHYPLAAQIYQGQCDALWGFYGAPDTMTSSGQDLFLNMTLGRSCQSVLFLPDILNVYP